MISRFLTVVLLSPLLSGAAFAQDLERGQRLYDRWCAECHGFDGAGDGSAAAFMMPRPRDFTLGVYQIRTTANGELPTDADLERVIRTGMPGTAMPGWESKFNNSEIGDLVAYVKSFSRFFEQFGAPEPLDFGSPPRVTDEGLAEGRRLYEEIECWKCHGEFGRSDGSSAPTLQDDLDFPALPANLTKNWTFNGGGTTEDIYRRLRTGLDGSPMPSFSDLIDSGFMTEEQLWQLAQYVRSLAPNDPPVVKEVIAAVRVEGDLPASVEDPAWEDVDEFYIPMVGQIVEEPRWFAPMVNGLHVRAAHNDVEMVVRVAWHDPSHSPDPNWLEWQSWVSASVYTPAAPPEPSLLADGLIVQFPTTIPTGRERPYFLMGNTRRPVYLWQWDSESGQVSEARATGLGTQTRLTGDRQSLAASAIWNDGEWSLQVRRSLSTPDSGEALQFRVGEPIPISFFAWDGSNGESGSRIAISSWYAIYLEEPTSSTVFLSPIIAILITAALGFLVVGRAQRREGVEAQSTQQ